LLERAVRAGYMSLDEINERVVESAMEVAEDSEDMEEIGSSDETYAMKDFLEEAGFQVDFVDRRLTRTFADGGMFDDNDGFMKADNNRNFRYPEKEVYVEIIDEPIDLISEFDESNNVDIKPLSDDIDLTDDKKIKARLTQQKRGNGEKFLAIAPNAFEFMGENIPMPSSNKHKND
jgi:hypothetical protein